jgi:hypothetical protein
MKEKEGDVLEFEDPEPPFDPPFEPPFPPPPPFRFSNPTYSSLILVGRTTGRGMEVGVGIGIGTSRTFSISSTGTFTTRQYSTGKNGEDVLSST